MMEHTNEQKSSEPVNEGASETYNPRRTNCDMIENREQLPEHFEYNEYIAKLLADAETEDSGDEGPTAGKRVNKRNQVRPKVYSKRSCHNYPNQTAGTCSPAEYCQPVETRLPGLNHNQDGNTYTETIMSASVSSSMICEPATHRIGDSSPTVKDIVPDSNQFECISDADDGDMEDLPSLESIRSQALDNGTVICNTMSCEPVQSSDSYGLQESNEEVESGHINRGHGYSSYMQKLLSEATELPEENDDNEYLLQFLNDVDEDSDEDDTFIDDSPALAHGTDSPIYRGHWLTVRCALILILTFATAHSITGSQLSDLLTLVSYFMLESHPAFKSIHMFKKYFADVKSPLIKHYYCAKCFATLTIDDNICSNALCMEDYTEKKKSYFIEMPIQNQVKDLFGRKGFFEKLQHRFKRTKTNVHGIEDLYDGLLYREMFENNGPLSNLHNISFTWNTDGVPVFKSSKFQLWPMYLVINELDIKQRMRKENMIFAGLWFAETKPIFSKFAQPLLEDLISLEEKGIDVEVQGKLVNSKAFLLYGCADLPARSAVLNMNQFNGNCSCVKCLQPGRNERTAVGGNIQVFPFIEDNPIGPERTSSQCIEDAITAFNTKKPVNGIKGPSPLLAVKSYNFVKGTVIDYMHGVLLGVTKVLINLWFSSSNNSEAFSLYSDIGTVDEHLLAIKVTHNISRVPQAIGAHFKFWKASELRSWLLFYSLPILIDIMDTSFFLHYACLVEAVYILSGTSISHDDIEKSYHHLLYFVLMFEPLYGIRYCGLNLHSLLHLPQTVQEVGPLWAINCFGFEDANGQIMKLFHGTQNVDIQITSAINISHLLPQMIKQLPPNSKVLSFIMKLQRKKCASSSIDVEILPLGKGYAKELSCELYSAVIHCLGKLPEGLVFYNRLLVRKCIFHSLSYSRKGKRNSYTVKYLLNGDVKFGYVSFYAKNSQDCGCEMSECSHTKFLAFIQRMEACTPRLSQFPGLDNYMKVTLAYIHEMKLTGYIDVINMENIVSLCLDICFGKSAENTHFVCEFANFYEFD